MARLYHKAYRRGGGRRGGYKLASPDPITYSAWAYDGDCTETAPAHLGTYTSALYGTTLRKISDQTAFSTASEFIRPDYMKKPFECGGRYGARVVWTRAEPAFTCNGPEQASPYAFVEQLALSASDQYASQITNRIYGISATSRLFRYIDTVSGVRTTVKDFSATYAYLATLNESCPSNDEDRWVFAGRKGDNTWDIFVYQISTDSIIATYTPGITDAGTAPGDINWISMSQDGAYFVIGPSATLPDGKLEGVHSFRCSDSAYMGRVSDNANHGDSAVLADGVTQVWVSMNDAGNLIYGRLDTAAQTTVISGWSTKQTWDYWISARNIDRPGYVYVSNRKFKGLPTKNPGADLAYAVNLSNGEIERWCRLQGPELADGSTENYAVPSRDGKRLYVGHPDPIRTSDATVATYVCTYEPSGT